jgi:hypothetical protein
LLFVIKDTASMPDAASMADRENMHKQLSSMYDRLQHMRMDQHARDFWRIRAVKQEQQLLMDPLLHEHTALTQYMQWHNNVGARLPSFMRGTPMCLANAAAKK